MKPGRPAELAAEAGEPVRINQQPNEIRNWQAIITIMGPVRRKWDLAIIAYLEPGSSRPQALLGKINEGSAENGRPLTWKVLTDSLRRLESQGYVQRREISRLPRETRYYLLPPARWLLQALDRAREWYETQENTGTGLNTAGETTNYETRRRFSALLEDDT